jgi:hypothetical protein
MSQSLLKMPLAVPSVDDWLVGIRYIGWDGKERVRVIAVQPKAVADEASAKATALQSISHRGDQPPQVKNIIAKRAIELGITRLLNRKQPFLEKVKL